MGGDWLKSRITYGNPVMFFFNSVIGSAAVIMFAMKFNVLGFINKWGQCSLYVYGIHYLFMQFGRVLLKNIKIENKIIGTVIIFAISIIVAEISYLLSRFFQKKLFDAKPGKI